MSAFFAIYHRPSRRLMEKRGSGRLTTSTLGRCSSVAVRPPDTGLLASSKRRGTRAFGRSGLMAFADSSNTVVVRCCCWEYL